MNELRISLGLLGCTAFLLAIAPSSPTLVSVAPAKTSAATVEQEPDTALPAIASREAGIPPVAETAETAIRAINPASYAAVQSGALPPKRVAASPAPTSPANVPPQIELFNRPIAVDAGTMKAGRTTLRVADVEPIAPDARCEDGAQTWPCGIRARTAFRSWLRGRSVQCAVPPDQQGASDLNVSCHVGDADIGEWLVANGWAAASTEGRYADLGQTAKTERRGIWAYEVGR